MVRQHVMRRDLGAVLDGRAEVDPAPDAGVADVVLAIARPRELAIAEPGQARDR